MISNIAGAVANSPELLRAFLCLFQRARPGTFTEAEIQTLLLTNDITKTSNRAVAFHTVLTLKKGLTQEDVDAIRAHNLLADPRLAALSHLDRKQRSGIESANGAGNG